jgi:hypothetical protein
MPGNLCKALLPLILAAVVTSNSRANEDSERKARMDQCIKLLQPQDKALKNFWRGHCGETELDAELAAMRPGAGVAVLESQGDDGRAASGNTCGAALGYTPVSRTSACGKGATSLRGKLSGNAVERIRLPGGKCLDVIPLLLTNKTDFACNAVQSRIACLDSSYDARSDTTTLVFRTERRSNSYSTTVVVTAADMQRVADRAPDLITDPQFVLVPSVVSKAKVVDAIDKAVQSTKSDCIVSGRQSSYCERRSFSKSDQLMQEWIRRFRNPRKDSPEVTRNADAKSLVASMRSRGLDKMLEEWLLFRSIAANEVSLEIRGDRISAYDPIYGVSDAIADDSGLSFGAHQIDIGANSPAEIKLFWDIMSDYLSDHRDDALEQAKAMQACINLPMRLETLRALDITYKAASGMTEGLRSARGRADYDGRLAKYLDEQVAKTKTLGGLFGSSMLARVLYSDRENQFGSPAAVVSRAQAVTVGKNLESCDDVLEAENELMEHMLWQWSNDTKVLKDGKPVHASYFGRYETVRDIVRSSAPAGGRSHCN